MGLSAAPPGTLEVHVEVTTTPYGGRCFVATAPIPCGSLIHTCVPFAHVVYRAYRKEVCATCLAFIGDQQQAMDEGQLHAERRNRECPRTWTSRLRNWDVKAELLELELLSTQAVLDQVTLPVPRKANTSVPSWRFCTLDCKRHFFNREGSYIMALVEDAIDDHARTLVDQARRKTTTCDTSAATCNGSASNSLPMYSGTTPIAKDHVDHVWAAVESYLSIFKNTPSRDRYQISTRPAVQLASGKAGIDPQRPLKAMSESELHSALSEEVNFSAFPMTELELDTARFVAAALVRRCIDETPSAQHGQSGDAGSASQTSSKQYPWTAVLALQSNELAHARTDRHALSSSLRVYAFLKEAISKRLVPLTRRPKRDKVAEHSVRPHVRDTKNAVTLLCEYITTSAAVRAVLAREDGNVFGLYSGAETSVPHADDGTVDIPGSNQEIADGTAEMLGFAMYIEGSYFNHSCTPNVVKRRVGREMRFYAARDVAEGEELCIAYVEVGEDCSVTARQDELEKNWYFKCRCARCIKEENAGSS